MHHPHIQPFPPALARCSFPPFPFPCLFPPAPALGVLSHLCSLPSPGACGALELSSSSLPWTVVWQSSRKRTMQSTTCAASFFFCEHGEGLKQEELIGALSPLACRSMEVSTGRVSASDRRSSANRPTTAHLLALRIAQTFLNLGDTLLVPEAGFVAATERSPIKPDI